MTVRAREEATPRPAARRALFGDESGVSPVVGMILVLGISIVGIAAILYWGLPAIDEMKANVEHRSLETQFLELDATIKELVTGTTEKTAKRWQPQLNRGNLLTQTANAEGWLFALETYQADKEWSFVYDSLADGNHRFNLTSITAGAANVQVKASRISGAQSEDLVVSGPAQADGVQVTADALTANVSREYRVFTGAGVPEPLTGASYRLRVYADGKLLAEAYYMTTGRVDYNLLAGIGEKAVVENNGAVITGNGGTYSIVNTPPIPPPTSTGGVMRFFGRAIALTGTLGFAGDDRFDVLVSLSSTSTLASYDCAQPDYSDCAESAKIIVYGEYKDVWYSYLTNPNRGYGFTEKTDGGVTYIEQRDARMGYTLLQSTVRLTS